MTAAPRRKPWVLSWARRYVRRRLSTQFDGLFIEGLTQAQSITRGEPVIVACNHVAWWDAFIAVQLDALLGTESYCLMDQENLARLPFFAWLGALPLARGVSKLGLMHMQAAATLLDRPGRALWIFPQGRQRAAHLRPLAPAAGVQWLGRKARVRVLPLALSYAFREAPEPSIVASFGQPLSSEGKSLLPQLEAEWVEALARIDAFVDRAEGSFVRAIAPRRSARGRTPWAGSVLAWLAQLPDAKRLGRGGTEAP